MHEMQAKNLEGAHRLAIETEKKEQTEQTQKKTNHELTKKDMEDVKRGVNDFLLCNYDKKAGCVMLSRMRFLPHSFSLLPHS